MAPSLQGLGYGILAGSTMVKIPQIIAVLKAGSAEGLSPLSIELETLGYCISAAYGFLLGLPFSAYGEVVVSGTGLGKGWTDAGGARLAGEGRHALEPGVVGRRGFGWDVGDEAGHPGRGPRPCRGVSGAGVTRGLPTRASHRFESCRASWPRTWC